MYLLFDTETTGLPRNWNAPMEDSENWPRVVQIAWLEYDKNGKEISKGDYIIKPNGFEIPNDAARIHKISTARAIDEGEELSTILKVFGALIDKSEYLVAHNINFDIMVIGAELKREYISSDIKKKKQICTMKESVDFCKIPGKTRYKFPKLAELYRKLFDEGFKEAHNAAADIEATSRCFWELKKQNIILPNKIVKIKEEKDDEELSLF